MRVEYEEAVIYRLRGSHLVLGRDAENEIRVNAKAVSSQHCVFRRDDNTGKFEIADYGSTNGTRVNGSPIDANGVVLKDADVILLGETVEIQVIEAREENVVERQPEPSGGERKPSGPLINPVAAAVAQQMDGGKKEPPSI